MIGMDLKRLLDHEVELFGLDLEAVWRVIRSFAHYCMKYSVECGDIQVVPEDKSRLLQEDNPFTFIMARSNPKQSFELALTNLLRQPRILKHALRRTWVAWQSLHGEADFEDLLVYNTLLTVDSEAIAFVQDRLPDFVLDRSGETTEDRKTRLAGLHNAAIRTSKDNDKVWLWVLLKALFHLAEGHPISPGNVYQAKGQKVQGADKERYWGRIANGWIDPMAVRDQTVIKNVREWKVSSDPSIIVAHLMADAPYTEIFELLFTDWQPAGIVISGADVLVLASRLFEEMRGRFGVQASSESCPGFFPLWRMMSRGRHFKDYEEWLWSEMAKTIPVSLSLRNDLEHYWADKYTPSMPTNMANLVARFRTKTAEAACEQLDATQLCRLLSGVRSWVLYHLVAGTGNTSSDMPVWKEWQWIGPVLLKGIAVCPCTMIPQAANLFIKSDNRIHRSAAEGGEHSAGSHIEWVYSVKKEWIKELFPDLKARSQFVKAMLQSAECEDQWPLDTRCMVQQARQELAAWKENDLQ